MSPHPPAPASSRARDVHAGRLLLGLALAALGVLWLLQALDVATIDWNLGLPIAVIAIGAALLVAGLLGRGSGGLVLLGIALTVLLLASTVVEVPLGGGVGDRTYRPTTVRSRSYELAMGQLTIDLTRIGLPESLPGEIRASAHVGVGQLLVIIPQRFPCVATHAKSGIGGVDVFGRSRDGFGAEYRTAAACSAAPLVHLDLTVGIGEVEVRRG
jgi:Cell wall-active antibiotics response 4TMS YvqF